MSITLENIIAELRQDVNRFKNEVAEVESALVRPTWQSTEHHFSMTLYGFLMGIFARIDLYSTLWDSKNRPNQTSKMRAFLARYLDYSSLAHALAVQLWRHTLMHTSRPRRLRDCETGKEYRYLLHWGPPHLPKEQHYQVAGDDKLNIGLLFLVDDLQALLREYVRDLQYSEQLQGLALSRWPSVEVQEFRLLSAEVPTEQVPVTRAVGTIKLAAEFHAAAGLEVKVAPRVSMVSYFLLCRCLELTFKSVLIVHGSSDKALRKIGHDLHKGMTAAVATAPSLFDLTDADVLRIRLLSPVYKEKAFEYVEPGRMSLPEVGDIRQLADRLIPTVKDYVDRRVRSFLRNSSAV